MILCTVSTVGARRFSRREREITYRCSSAYSRADIVYRKAFRRIGSAADAADGLAPPAPGRDGPAGEAMASAGIPWYDGDKGPIENFGSSGFALGSSAVGVEPKWKMFAPDRVGYGIASHEGVR